MLAVVENGLILAFFNLGGGEIILILALVLILFGAKTFPDLRRGLGQGLFQFRKSSREIADAMDDEASKAGRSLGGIYGKPAAQALTPDNQVAELYDPALLQDEREPRKSRSGVTGPLSQLRRWVRRLRKRLPGIFSAHFAPEPPSERTDPSPRPHCH